jgi:hypothetical protein
MAYRIVAKSPEKLDDILADIKEWFANTKDYVSKFETEKRKFADPATKQIVSKDIDVIYVKDMTTKKETKIMLIPLLKPGEMKVEMGGENEHVMKGKIKNMMKGRGDFKSYNKDTLRKMEAVEKLRNVIREEVSKVLTEVQAPAFQAKHKDNNLVVAIYFSWNKAESNNRSLWDKVIQVIEQADCKLINYVVTDSVCEFEFQPIGAYDQDLLEDARYQVTIAIKHLSSKFTGYDVYIVGN